MEISSSLAGAYSPSLGSQNSRPAQNAAPAASADTASTVGDAAEQAFLNYMKESPAQKLEDQWLAAHHLTRKELDAMPPKQREAILKQMEAEIKQQLKQQTEAKTRARTNLLV
jgi:hypothetical protein